MKQHPFRPILVATVIFSAAACQTSPTNDGTTDDLRHRHADLAQPPDPTDMAMSGGGDPADLSASGGGGTGGGGDTAAAKVIAIDPESAPPGATVAVSGSGFSAGDTVQISNATYGTIALATVSLSAGVIWATLPSSVQPGAATVKVQHAGASTNSLAYTVTPGRVFYVATTGSDSNPGTLAQPWKTMEGAQSKLSPGDTVYIRGGTYAGAHVITVSGTASARINFVGYPGESPIIVNDASNYNNLSIQGSYLTFDHLKVTQPFDRGKALEITLGKNHVTLSNCEVYGSVGQGVMLIGDHNTIIRNAIHDNGSYQNQDHGMYVEGQYNNIQYNRIYNNWAYGLHLYSESGQPGGNNLVEGNLIYHNGYGGVSSVGSTSTSGMIVAESHPSDTIRNNVFCDNANYGVVIRAGLPNNTFTGNVSCYNKRGGFEFEQSGAGDTFTGNVSYNDAGAALDAQSPLVSNKNWYWKVGGTPSLSWSGTTYSSLSAFQSASGQDALSKVADPQFKNVPSASFDSTKITSYDFCSASMTTLCNQ
jgi:hypothetical protein